MVLLRQLFDAATSTYSYLLGSDGEALLIDPVFEQARRDAALVHELGLRLVATVETHVHADHVTAAWLHQQRCGSRIVVPRAGGASGADRLLDDGDAIGFGTRRLLARATPGHTDGCTSYVLDDASMAFTGDSLLIRGCGRTDFQQGSPARLFRSVRERLLTLPDACLLYPGHDYRGLTVTSVAEERRYNPRLGGDADEADFTGYMNNLGLPHPQRMAQAVPANLQCGRVGDGARPPPEPDWAALNYTFGGIWEIEPLALAECRAPVQIIDVRETAEFDDDHGHLRGAVSIPIGRLAQRFGELDRARPVVAVCRSGTRSAQAVVLLNKAGFDAAANLAGGMLRWHTMGLPVVRAGEA